MPAHSVTGVWAFASGGRHATWLGAGSGTCYQVGFAGVACGIARGALDYFVDLARNKMPRGFKSPLRDNAVIQSGLAQAEAGLRAARGFVLQSMADAWKELQAGASISVDQRIT